MLCPSSLSFLVGADHRIGSDDIWRSGCISHRIWSCARPGRFSVDLCPDRYERLAPPLQWQLSTLQSSDTYTVL